MKKNIKYTIVIPTRNRAQYLKTTLKSLKKTLKSKPEFEVLIIDNNSNDNTTQIYEDIKNEFLNIRYISQKKIGLHECRNLAIDESMGEIICYLDDDVELFADWAEGVIESFQNEKVLLVGGKDLPNFEVTPPDWILKTWEGKKLIGYLSVVDLGDEIIEIDPFLVFGCNFNIRKTVLIEAGGFHPDGFPQNLIKYRGDGESYISKYLKDRDGIACYNPKVSVYHLVTKERMTEKYFRRRAFNQGISDSYTQIRSFNGNISKVLKLLVNNIVKLVKNILLIQIQSTWKSKLKGAIYHQISFIFSKKFRKYVLKNNYLETN